GSTPRRPIRIAASPWRPESPSGGGHRLREGREAGPQGLGQLPVEQGARPVDLRPRERHGEGDDEPRPHHLERRGEGRLCPLPAACGVRAPCPPRPPLGDAASRTTGLPSSSPLETIQSSAFLSAPGTPCAYSGVEMTTPSAARRSARSSATAGGGTAPSPSRSGENIGSAATRSS